MNIDGVKVSIIIPVYNKEKYIRKTLESVVNQTFINYEVIIINDGSTDNSLSIIEEFLQKYKQIQVYTIPNSGVSNARNIGLKYAKGEWIQFLDGDDILEKYYLNNIIEKVTNNDIDIVFSDFEMINEFDDVIKNIEHGQYGIYDQEELMKFFLQSQYQNGFFGYISNKLIRKEVIIQSRASFPTDITLAEDLAFYLQIYPSIKQCMFISIYSFSYLQTSNNYIYNDEIDYRKQMIIQLLVKKWFKEKDKYIYNRRIIDRKISDYAYFIIFYDNEKGIDLSIPYNEIVNNRDIFESLSVEDLDGIEKKVIKFVENKNLDKLKFLFFVRNKIRNIYRRGR